MTISKKAIWTFLIILLFPGFHHHKFDFTEAVKELKQRHKKMENQQRACEIDCCIIGIENHLAGKYAEPFGTLIADTYKQNLYKC